MLEVAYWTHSELLGSTQSKLVHCIPTQVALQKNFLSLKATNCPSLTEATLTGGKPNKVELSSSSRRDTWKL